MNLSDFPIPRNLSKRGMHGSASMYPEEGHWRERLAICSDMGIGWMKFVDDGGASGLNVYRSCWHDYGMIPIVRFYIGTPGQCGSREADAIKRIADTLGFATYFELCNEPDLPIEWNYNQPKDWLYRAVDAYCDYAPKVLAAGGLPGTFALASGAFSNLRIDEHGNEIPPIKVNFLQLITDRIGTGIFNSGGWIAMHNYHINHPVAYPYDAVNQSGQQLTVAEYEAVPLWAWDNRAMADINAQRLRDQNPGDTIWDDDTCFGAYKVFLSLLDELGLDQTPIITTEGGPTITRGDDGRYPKTYIDLMVQLLEQTYRELGPIPRYLAYCHWMLYNTTGGWATDCWLGGSEDYSKAIALFKETPVGTWGEKIGSEPTEPGEPEEPEEPVEEPELINDAEAYGVTVISPEPLVGEKYWKAIKVHHLTPEENNGQLHVFLDVLKEDGSRYYGAQVEGWWGGAGPNEVVIATVDKPANEPGTNIVLSNIRQVTSVGCISDGYDSDVVSGMHTNWPDEEPVTGWGHNGNAVGHHSYLVVFQLVTKAGEVEEPTEPEPEPDETSEELVRRTAWDNLYPGPIERNPDAAFQKRAAYYGWLAPVTKEFRVSYNDAVIAGQGFVDGILECIEGDWEHIYWIKWNA